MAVQSVFNAIKNTKDKHNWTAIDAAKGSLPPLSGTPVMAYYDERLGTDSFRRVIISVKDWRQWRHDQLAKWNPSFAKQHCYHIYTFCYFVS